MKDPLPEGTGLVVVIGAGARVEEARERRVERRRSESCMLS